MRPNPKKVRFLFYPPAPEGGVWDQALRDLRSRSYILWPLATTLKLLKQQNEPSGLQVPNSSGF